MIEELRIKCPACGIILDVRNSRHETVKKIACPNCKKQLAVNFADDADAKSQPAPQPIGAFYEGTGRHPLNEGMNVLPGVPSGLVELRVVRLADGSCKHILRALTDEQQVQVNGQPLSKDDEVVLLRGDELQTGHRLLTFDKPGRTLQPEPTATEPLTAPSPEPTPAPTPQNTGKSVSKLFYVVPLMMVVFSCLAYLFYHRQPQPASIQVATDTVVLKQTTRGSGRGSGDGSPILKSRAETGSENRPLIQPDSPAPSATSFDLELQASKGNVSAQYELGRQLLHKRGSSNVIMGINYLRLASRNGSSKAEQTLQKAIRTLQQKSAAGDSTADYILRQIN